MKPIIILSIVIAFSIAFPIWRRMASQEHQQDPDEFMTGMAKQAVLAAHDEFKIDLDYSLDSIQKVEKMLGQLHNYYARNNDKSGMEGYAIAFGAYIGETLKRHVGRGHWERNHPAGGEDSWPFVWENGDHVSFPCAWSYKRMENGAEDNVWYKTQVFLDDDKKTSSTAVNRGIGK